MKVFGMILISIMGLSQILTTLPLIGKTFVASQILLKIMNRFTYNFKLEHHK
jgi:hypothetical protein